VHAEHGLALVAHHAHPLVAALLLLLHLSSRGNKNENQSSDKHGRIRRGVWVGPGARLHGGALHALQGEEERRHG
jgi:hypothetical protein